MGQRHWHIDCSSQFVRIEKDSLGQVEVPSLATYGAQSLRAATVFQVSGTQIHTEFVRSYLRLKKAAAIANQAAGVLGSREGDAIIAAVDQLLAGNLQEHYIIDTYQAGAGTSQNMNTNEVIANIANVSLGSTLGSNRPVHPNDHVNASQSTNDTYPTVMRLATLKLSEGLFRSLSGLAESFDRKGSEFDPVVKSARTHLQDAVPIRLGQEFRAYGGSLRLCVRYLEEARDRLKVLGIGGSAAGTGINVPPGYRERIVRELQRLFSIPDLSSAPDLIQAMQSQLPMLFYSNALRAIAVELTRILNDLRLMASGPHTGLAEIILPAVMPGSSIMPGKINPSVLEMGNQVCFKILGNDASMAFAVQAGQLELNVMMPLMSHLALESTHILTHALDLIRVHCVDGIRANVERCWQYVEESPEIVTALNPVLGYEKGAELAKQAVRDKTTILKLVREQKLLSEEQIRALLDPKKLTEA